MPINDLDIQKRWTLHLSHTSLQVLINRHQRRVEGIYRESEIPLFFVTYAVDNRQQGLTLLERNA